MRDNVRCFIVDWDRLAAQVRGAAELRAAVKDHTEVPLLDRSLWAQDQLLKCAEAMRDALPGASTGALCELFSHLFWSFRGRERRVVDLPGQAGPAPEVAWSPAMTRRFARAAGEVDLLECRRFFEVENPHRSRTLYGSWAEFVGDARPWLDGVKEAAAGHRGLVVLVEGDRA